jgi:hypothetical protein
MKMLFELKMGLEDGQQLRQRGVALTLSMPACQERLIAGPEPGSFPRYDTPAANKAGTF